MEVFTPLNADRTKRLTFDAKDVEVLSGDLNVRGLGKKAVVRINGRTYQVYGASCSFPQCACDAFIREIDKQEPAA
ncbi:hypothetical protein JHN55_25265 [Streptomyces sp. MBT56]|uniref:hypothetical protein n=1 Tax=unclassified Streptomyces TaxID=2593676 RepID=UPI00190B3BAF|nr:MULTISPECIES: hypothetical protein [unclassified Streptomyces]MBK3559775.1 hypothetical protein [Streptomyces sp. MBT56]MBK3601283.1 hypothetical protein [Streptomyces sp. MBT54]MBK3615270.1 hypothetical protein [Streptomyces sp. MBT98]